MQNDLTAREQLILEMLLKGMSPKEISFNLNVKYTTVDYHKNRIYKKLGVQSIQELFVKYGKTVNGKDHSGYEAADKYTDDSARKNTALAVNTAGDVKFDWAVYSDHIAKKKIIKPVPALITALVISVLLNIFLLASYFLSISNKTNMPSAGFASVKNPLVISMIYGQPWGYNYNFSLPDCFIPQIFEGDIYTLHYILKSDCDMSELSVNLIDRSDEASEGCWLQLTDAPPFLHMIRANFEYKGSVKLKVHTSAYNERTISNLFEFGTDNFPDKPPVLTFTRFEVVKEN